MYLGYPWSKGCNKRSAWLVVGEFVVFGGVRRIKMAGAQLGVANDLSNSVGDIWLPP